MRIMSRKRFSVNIQNSLISPVQPACAPFSSPASPTVGGENLAFSKRLEASNVKLLLVGDAGVGKTAMILGFCNELPTKSQLNIMNLAKDSNNDRDIIGIRSMRSAAKKKRYSLSDYEELFQGLDDLDEYVLDTRTTIGVDIKSSLLTIDSRLFKCIIWDTAGQERYRNAMVPILYRDAHGIVLTYDLCDTTSLNSICDHWLQEALDNYGSNDFTKVRFYLVGNKSDLTGERKVTQEQVLHAVEILEARFPVKIAGTWEVTCKWPNIVDRTFNQLVLDLVANGCYDSKSDEIRSNSEDRIDGDSHSGTLIHENSGSDQQRLGLNQDSKVAQEKEEEVHIPGGIDLTKPYYIGRTSSTCCT